jgi:hypothetical protein
MWDSLLAKPEAQRLMMEMAREALAEHHAGLTVEMAFDEDGNLIGLFWLAHDFAIIWHNKPSRLKETNYDNRIPTNNTQDAGSAECFRTTYSTCGT